MAVLTGTGTPVGHRGGRPGDTYIDSPAGDTYTCVSEGSASTAGWTQTGSGGGGGGGAVETTGWIDENNWSGGAGARAAIAAVPSGVTSIVRVRVAGGQLNPQGADTMRLFLNGVAIGGFSLSVTDVANFQVDSGVVALTVAPGDNIQAENQTGNATRGTYSVTLEYA